MSKKKHRRPERDEFVAGMIVTALDGRQRMVIHNNDGHIDYVRRTSAARTFSAVTSNCWWATLAKWGHKFDAHAPAASERASTTVNNL